MTEKSVEIIRSKRKTISVEIRRDLSVVVRAPMRMRSQEIQRFIQEKAGWIERNQERLRERSGEGLPKFTQAEIQALADRAVHIIPERVARFASLVGVDYGRITIRNQVSRWGSCSSKGNLNFNCLLMLCPPEVLDYVVVHELCHRKQMNHSPAFWGEVARVLPSYQRERAWLRENEGALIGRLRG
ncbi:MAG TPA: M48 family metallopeptidase [Candidatus Flavonifractor merdigallinarum]|uniref:M48 family metallopeptidase n=1 Tax=Candidatus Flavonifractor merdigallinarum TaxID=2838589 RepID=A0A9D1Y6J8_9FIRM|nr:M48 family metallopeptidase [Candidatus Flavonifractor merdigallinarum]